jgi:hypothetical protein
LPEVIEAEIHKHLVRAGLEAAGDIGRGARELRTLLGAFPATAEPSADRIAAAIRGRLSELSPLLERHAMTLEHARSAMQRVNDETPPNGPKNQQFKDSLIWESLLELAKRFDVCFVTKDAAFFKDKGKMALASPLLEESIAPGTSLRVYSDLKPVLELLRAEIPDIDRRIIADAAYGSVREELERDASSKKVRLGTLLDYKVSPFLTEDHDVLAISFSLRPEVIDLDEESRRDDFSVNASGQCSYSLSTGLATNVLLDRIEYKWTDEDGQRRSNNSVYARGSVVLGSGSRDVPHIIREDLP